MHLLMQTKPIIKRSENIENAVHKHMHMHTHYLHAYYTHHQLAHYIIYYRL